MDEFRKPYEYTEEKRGFILLFIIMLITIDIYQALIYIIPAYNSLKEIPVLGDSFMVMSIIYLLFILFTAFTCYKLKKNMITISKAYLILRTFLLICCIILLFVNNYDVKRMIGYGKQYTSKVEFYFKGLLAPLLFVLVFSIGWFLYFLKSKRCKEISIT